MGFSSKMFCLLHVGVNLLSVNSSCLYYKTGIVCQLAPLLFV
jgi:hypothetical protein